MADVLVIVRQPTVKKFMRIDSQRSEKIETLPSSLGSLSVTVVVAHEGKLPANSLQSDKFNSKLSNVEKLLRDESQLKF